MSSQDAVNHLLESFSSALRIVPPLTLDAAGVCAFEYDNEVSIALEVPDPVLTGISDWNRQPEA